jgi:uncharacterized protein YjbI with pentapeptide repeats
VPKRRAALPRGIQRTIGGIAAVVLGLAIAWVLFVLAADWLAHHDVGSVKGSLHETALDNARARLLTLGAGLFAAGALVFTARNFILSREGQVTDRYTKAIEQLGSEKLDVRIGGIYALERIAHDSARDHPTVMEVLSAFIREHSRGQWPSPESGGAEPQQLARPDVQAAVTVVGRRNEKRDIRPIDLRGADLRGADLTRLNLRGANLSRVNLAGANLPRPDSGGPDLGDAILHEADLSGADLSGGDLRGADLQKANLHQANLQHADLGVMTRIDLRLTTSSIVVNLALADLREADLRGARLRRADLIRADLQEAHLELADFRDALLVRANLARADLSRADLRGADLHEADLRGAILRGANLRGVDLRKEPRGLELGSPDLRGADFTGADLGGVRWPIDAPVPPGWNLDTGSDVLESADAESGPGEAD